MYSTHGIICMVVSICNPQQHLPSTRAGSSRPRHRLGDLALDWLTRMHNELLASCTCLVSAFLRARPPRVHMYLGASTLREGERSLPKSLATLPPPRSDFRPREARGSARKRLAVDQLTSAS